MSNLRVDYPGVINQLRMLTAAFKSNSLKFGCLSAGEL